MIRDRVIYWFVSLCAGLFFLNRRKGLLVPTFTDSGFSRFPWILNLTCGDRHHPLRLFWVECVGLITTPWDVDDLAVSGLRMSLLTFSSRLDHGNVFVYIGFCWVLSRHYNGTSSLHWWMSQPDVTTETIERNSYSLFLSSWGVCLTLYATMTDCI